MILKFLGTGTSQGVPVIGCNCDVCLSSDSRDKRLRTSALIQIDDVILVIDCGPDFRQQILRSEIFKIDAILFTHHHNDHVVGLDDLRPINFLLKRNIDVYLNDKTFQSLQKRFDYIFDSNYPGVTGISSHVIEAGERIHVKGVDIIALEVDHGNEKILGYQIESLTYLTDVKRLSNTTIDLVKNCDVLVISALRYKEHRTHLSLDQALDYIDKINPGRAYLTHMSHLIGLHSDVDKELPPNVSLAYDNLEVQVN